MQTSRRQFLKGMSAGAALVALAPLAKAFAPVAPEYTVAYTIKDFTGGKVEFVTYGGEYDFYIGDNVQRSFDITSITVKKGDATMAPFT